MVAFVYVQYSNLVFFGPNAYDQKCFRSWLHRIRNLLILQFPQKSEMLPKSTSFDQRQIPKFWRLLDFGLHITDTHISMYLVYRRENWGQRNAKDLPT